MLEFTHAVTGATLTSIIPNPLVSLPLCFLSNIIIDLFPHWNPHLFSEKQEKGKLSTKTILFLLCDSFLGLFLGLWIAAASYPDLKKVLIILLGSFLSVLADLIEAPYYLFNWQNKFVNKLISFQRSHQWNVSFWPGIIFQVSYTLLLLGILGKIW